MKLKMLTLMVLLSVFGFAETIKVAVAANVSYAIEDLKKRVQCSLSRYGGAGYIGKYWTVNGSNQKQCSI